MTNLLCYSTKKLHKKGKITKLNDYKVLSNMQTARKKYFYSLLNAVIYHGVCSNFNLTRGLIFPPSRVDGVPLSHKTKWKQILEVGNMKYIPVSIPQKTGEWSLNGVLDPCCSFTVGQHTGTAGSSSAVHRLSMERQWYNSVSGGGLQWREVPLMPLHVALRTYLLVQIC